MDYANMVTLARIPLLILNIYLLFIGSWLAAPLIVFIFFMDYLDGKIARWLDQESEMGAVLDIAVDRLVELSLWFYMTLLGWIPIWVPLVILTRGLLTDGIRSRYDTKPFDVTQSRFARVVISSRASRGLYGFLKLFTFFFVSINHIQGLGHAMYADLLVYLTVFYCVLRGLPVFLKLRQFD